MISQDVMNRTMIITGTRKGIGKGLAEHYIRQDWFVAGCSRKGPSIEHDRYSHYSLDVADESAVVAMVRDVARKREELNAVINNAGIASMNHLLLTPYETAKNIFKTNFFGAFLFCREAAKVMTRQKKGRIVNFTTVAAPLRLEGEALYAASKAALENLTQVLAFEMAPYGVTVNAVGPAPVATDLIKNVPPEKIETLLARQAFPRLGTVEDVANVTDFYLHERSGGITGQIIYLGGVHG